MAGFSLLLPQREVRAAFPKETDAFSSMKKLIQEGLEEDAIIEGKRDSSLSKIVDEIQKTLPKTEAEISEDQVTQADRDLEAEEISDAMKYSDRGYDFTKSFAEQIDDYRAGVFAKDDTLIVGTTPNVFLKIGLNRLPVTYARGHLKEVLKGTKVDHDFGEAILKQLPKAIKKPVAVITSQTQTSTSLELSHGGKQIIAAVRIDGSGKQNNIEIDTNAITTLHKRGNAITLLANAIQAEASGAVGVYYLDKNKTTRLLQHQGLQLPNILQNSSGYIHSITDPNSPVKPKLSSVLESTQRKPGEGRSAYAVFHGL